MASAAEIREALLALRNASSDDKAAAKARVTTLGQQTAMEITDKTARGQFVASLGDDIEDAMKA